MGDGGMVEPEKLFKAGVKAEYARHLEADRGDTRADDSSSCGEATYEEALAWAKTQTGLIEELEARAEEVAKGGLPPERIFESSVRAQYSAFLAEQKKPAGVSIRELAERAGVDAEAVREELESWQACGRLRITGDSVLIVEGGKGYPGEDGEDEDHREDGDKALDDSSPGGRGPGLFGGGAPGPPSEQARRFLAGQ